MGAEGDSGFYKATKMMELVKQLDLVEAIGKISLDDHPQLIDLALTGLASYLQKYQFKRGSLQMLQPLLTQKSEMFAKSEHAEEYEVVLQEIAQLVDDINGILELGYG